MKQDIQEIRKHLIAKEKDVAKMETLMTVGMVLLTFGKVLLGLTLLYWAYILWCKVTGFILTILDAIAWPALGILGVGTTFGLSIYLAVTGQASVSGAVGYGILAGIALFLIVGIVGGVLGGLLGILIPNEYLPESLRTYPPNYSSDFWAGYGAGQRSRD